VPGQPLGTVLDHLPMLDEIQAREIVVQVSLALRHLQKFGLVHGNLKPNNILLTHTGLVKLADCALAPFSGWGEVVIQSSRQWGAPYYCSPEHGRAGRHLDFRSDIYCLGVVLYEMLTGGVPFSGGIPILDLRRRMTETWPDPRSKNPRISDQGMAILQKMTVLSIDERYSSYDELLRDLESFPGFKRGPQPARKAEMDEEGKPEEWADTRLVETVEAQGSGRASRAEAVEPEDPHTGDFYRAAKAAESPEQTAEEEQGNKSFLDGSRELIALLEDAEKAQHKNPTPTKNLRVQEPDEDGSVGEEKPEPEAKKPAEEPERAEPPAPAPAEAAPAPPPVGASYRMAPLVIGLVSATLTALIALLVLYLSGAFG
jgi:serine/threonine protein kinase